MRPRSLIACSLAGLAVAIVGCGGDDGNKSSADKPKAAPRDAGATVSRAAARRPKPKISVPQGKAPAKVEIKDLQRGTQGAPLEAGDQVAVNYTGVLYKNGKQFDSSFGKQPFQFQLGRGMVIPGWDQGLVGARVGARRQLTIPADQAYGTQGQPPTIPPNAPLVFVIDVLAKR